MNRRAFFSFLPAAPFGVLMAAEAMAKAPPASMAPDRELMTLAAHKPPPPPPPKYPEWSQTFIGGGGGGGSGREMFRFNADGQLGISKSYVDNCFITSAQPTNAKLVIGKAVEIKGDNDFDETIKVAMSVGKDGHLWLKINDEWKRIVTE
jgi:hypothetical protein